MKNNTAIVLILLSVGLFYAFTSVQYKEVKALNTVAGEYKNVLGSISSIMELRDNLLVTYNSLPKEDVARLDKVVPDNVDAVRLALDLDGIAARYNISIKNIQVVLGSNSSAQSIVLSEYADSYERAKISFSFIANYENFQRFLGDIEKSLRVMDIKAVSFTASDSGLYDFQVSVDTYWLK